MRYRNSLITLTLVVVPLMAHAQSTVYYSAAPGQKNVHGITDQSLADGNSVWIGFFDSGFDVAASSDDLDGLYAAWNLLTKDTVKTIFGEPGRFSDNASTSDPTFDNSQIWFWIFQTSDSSTPDEGFGDVIGHGLFTGSGPNWFLPPQGLAWPDDETSVTSSQVDMVFYGSYDDDHLILQQIPEPSTVGLFLVGLGCLSLHLWRKQPANPFRR